MIPNVGDVVVVPFPFSDLPLAKPRPVVVLSRAAENDATGSTLVAIITTGHRSAWPGDVRLTDWRAAGLRTPSLVRAKLFNVDNRLIARQIGTLAEADRAAVRAALQLWIAI